MSMAKFTRYLYSMEQKLIEYRYALQENLGTVYMFHQINDNIGEWRGENCSITEKSFRKFLAALGNKNLAVKPIEDISLTAKGTVFLTFDDIFEDVYYKAFPLLQEKDYPFAAFMAIDLLDKPGYLTTSMTKELSRSSICTLGSHTVTHSVMRFQSEEEIRTEIIESRKKLEDIISHEVPFFAYPFGSVYACSKKNINAVKKSGYQAAFSTINSHLTHDNIREMHFLPRVNVNERNVDAIIKRMSE